MHEGDEGVQGDTSASSHAAPSCGCTVVESCQKSMCSSGGATAEWGVLTFVRSCSTEGMGHTDHELAVSFQLCHPSIA